MYHSSPFVSSSLYLFQYYNIQLVCVVRQFSILNSLLFKKWNHSSFSRKFKSPFKKTFEVLTSNDQLRRTLNDKSPYKMSDMSISASSDSGSSSEDTPGLVIRQFDSVIMPRTDAPTMDEGPVVKLRILNYNVLSQVLLERHHYLYRRQESYMLSWHYRRERILREITSVNPDIFCLQEVEEGELPFFYKHLETLGYKSVIKMKTRKRGDGLGIYYRDPGIKLLQKYSVEYSQPGVLELESRDNVGLIAKFEKEGKEFLVANTHLLYNPRRTEVRLAQLQILLAELHRITRVSKELQSRILLMGDLNSVPDSPVVRFLLEGQLLGEFKPLPELLGISPDTTHLSDQSQVALGSHRGAHTTPERHSNSISCSLMEVFSVSRCARFLTDKIIDFVLYHSEEGPQSVPRGRERYSIEPESQNSVRHLISHSFNFSSAYELEESDRRGVTTYQDKWVMVDYIFYSSGLELLSRLTLPTSEECSARVRFLPNHYFPSDHLPLAADFQII